MAAAAAATAAASTAAASTAAATTEQELLLLCVCQGAGRCCNGTAGTASAAALCHFSLRLLLSLPAAAPSRCRWLWDRASTTALRTGAVQRRRFQPLQLAQLNELAALLESAALAAAPPTAGPAAPHHDPALALKTHLVAALSMAGDFVWSPAAAKTIVLLWALPADQAELRRQGWGQAAAWQADPAAAVAADLLSDALCRTARKLQIRLVIVDTRCSQPPEPVCRPCYAELLTGWTSLGGPERSSRGPPLFPSCSWRSPS